MVQLQPIFKKAYWSLVAFGGIYGLFLICLTNPLLQRHAVYVHKIHGGNFNNYLSKPEMMGFAKNQITQFWLNTTDGESLFAWHILPLALYASHEMELQKQKPWPPTSFSSSLAYKLLVEDPDARVVINFHGNAGNVAQGYRPRTYRAITSTNLPIHVFTIDYRGFGFSTGVPSEAGLIADGVSLVKYVLSLGIPPSRIILLGQSLGTQVATAVALHFADPIISKELLPNEDIDINLPRNLSLFEASSGPTDFAAVILAASFPSMKKLLTVYRFIGTIPVLSPLRVYPYLQTLLLSFVRESWNTEDRIGALVKAAAEPGRKLRLHILHARDDWDISYRMGEENMRAAEAALAEAAKEEIGASLTGDVGETRRKEAWLGGSNAEERGGIARLRVIFELLMNGGHNRIVADVPVLLAVLRGFGLA